MTRWLCWSALILALTVAPALGQVTVSQPVVTATETTEGITERCTDAETVTGTATDCATTPANVKAKISAPGAVGDVTPDTGNFTTLTGTTGPHSLTGRTSVIGSVSFQNATGAEKVTDGTFTLCGASWTLGADWTCAAGVATKAATGTSTLSQASANMVTPLAATELYKVVHSPTFSVTTGGYTVSIGGATGTNVAANGTYIEYLLASSTAALTFTPGNAASAFTLDNVSVKKVATCAADQVCLWVEDETGTAGKATLYIRGENGTVVGIGGSGLTFGSLDGGVTLTPTDSNLLTVSGGDLAIGTNYLDLNSTYLSGPAAATLLLGKDAAAPTDQTIRAPNVSAGTSNIQGADWIIDPGVGRGTGRSGDAIIRTHAAGASGDTAGTLAGTLFVSSGEVGVGALPDGTALLHTKGSAAGFANVIKAENTSSATETNFTGFVMKVQSTEIGQFLLSGSANNYVTGVYGTSRLTFEANGAGGMQFLTSNAAPGNNIIAFKHGSGATPYTSLSISGAGVPAINTDSVIVNKRTRVTAAQINAGYTLLAAVTGLKYRIIDVTAIPIGGACAAVTSVEIRGTQSAGAVVLLSYAQANLTQSTILKPNSTGVTALADGASLAPNDVTTGITIIKNGADMTTCTNIDVTLTYALES